MRQHWESSMVARRPNEEIEQGGGSTNPSKEGSQHRNEKKSARTTGTLKERQAIKGANPRAT